MLRSYLSIGLAIVMVAQPLHAQESGNSSGEHSATEQGPLPTQNNPPIASSLDDEISETNAQQRNPYRDQRNQREIENLEAQESMARWARAMFWAIIAQTTLAFGALVALILDLKQNRKSAERQLRPYLDICEVHCGDRDGDGVFMIWFQVKNFGQTPATALYVKTGRDFLPYPISAMPTASYRQAENHAVPAGHPRTYHMGLYGSEAEWPSLIEQNKGSICFSIRYEYFDPVTARTWSGECDLIVERKALKSGRPRTVQPRDMADYKEEA